MSTLSHMGKFALGERLDKLLDKQDNQEASKRLRKALNLSSTGLLKEGMSIPRVYDRFPELVSKLETGFTAHSVLVLLDLSPFSSVVSGWNAISIKSFLDRYYRIVVDAVVENGGVIEKYIGDAVLAIFGEPFNEESTANNLYNALSVCSYLIEESWIQFKGEVALKAAITSGTCFFGYLGTYEHSELTVIGNALTELFRLEDICEQNSVVMPSSKFSLINRKFRIVKPIELILKKVNIDWRYVESSIELRGIGRRNIAILSKYL